MANGVSYAQAAALHRDAPDEAAVRAALAQVRDCGVTFFRDGGDKFGVSQLAKTLAPEYGIIYRTPVFILHREGFYGSMYGFGYRDMTGARALIAEARRGGADFIKIAVSGMLDFDGDGGVTGPALPQGEIAELVKLANGEGFAVMAHCNGAENVKNALLAGVSSIEHGFYTDADGVALMKETGAVWVPTCVTVANNLDGSRFPAATMRGILEKHAETLKYAAKRGVLIGNGSDSGAYNVPHGRGAADEAAFLASLGVDTGAGDAKIAEVF
jgi:hypothetical protein